jgi:hypothetical protein
VPVVLRLVKRSQKSRSLPWTMPPSTGVKNVKTECLTGSNTD